MLAFRVPPLLSCFRQEYLLIAKKRVAKLECRVHRLSVVVLERGDLCVGSAGELENRWPAAFRLKWNLFFFSRPM